MESRKRYEDPFNDVDVDVIFTGNGSSWRVPAFWDGGTQWTVRWAPPLPGQYTYRLVSTDTQNPDLNGHIGRVEVKAYTGSNPLLRHGMIIVSKDKRHFEQADGTPFFWLGDTWWNGLSSKLSWNDFQTLTANRKAKGFTVVQLTGGLFGMDSPASPPPLQNEGGPSWNPELTRLNPKFYDYADRRIQHLVAAGIAPAIVGGWGWLLPNKMSVPRLKKQWRYLVARYGAYPVFWILGGEVVDPSAQQWSHVKALAAKLAAAGDPSVVRQQGWTELAVYVRALDPYHHPITAHENAPPFDSPLESETLTDFDCLQPSHFGWVSVATEVAQLTLRYARMKLRKPIVVCEIGYEKLFTMHYEDFQRTAYWLAMLNGAAGYTYGARAYSYGEVSNTTARAPDFAYDGGPVIPWEDAMNFPGSTQISFAAGLLRSFQWWEFVPHPEWITPRGTTLLEPNENLSDSEQINEYESLLPSPTASHPLSETEWPKGDWNARHGTFHLPYAAGIPNEVRVIYGPSLGVANWFASAPTVLGLEPGIRYHAYYWLPSQAIKVDLGFVERPKPGALIYFDQFDKPDASAWTDFGARGHRLGRTLSVQGHTLSVLTSVNEQDLVASVGAHSTANAALVLRFQDPNNYLAAAYSAKERLLYIVDRKGDALTKVGTTTVASLGKHIRLTAEARGTAAIASVTDGSISYTTPIVNVTNIQGGHVGLLHDSTATQEFDQFEVRRSPALLQDDQLNGELYDTFGRYHGTLSGPDWEQFGRHKNILLNAWRPDKLPFSADWLLVLTHEGEK